MRFALSSKVSFLLPFWLIKESFSSALEFLQVSACVPSDLRTTSPDRVAGTRGQADGIADSEANQDTGGGLGGVLLNTLGLTNCSTEKMLSRGNRFSADAAVRWHRPAR